MSVEIGNIGETAAKLAFLRQGYEIYEGGHGNTFDFIAYSLKEHILSKVEVKTTNTRNKTNTGWVVRIGTRNCSGDTPFKKGLVDVLAVYVMPEDKVYVIPEDLVLNRHKLIIYDTADKVEGVNLN